MLLARFTARDGGLVKITMETDPGDVRTEMGPIWLLAASGLQSRAVYRARYRFGYLPAGNGVAAGDLRKSVTFRRLNRLG